MSERAQRIYDRATEAAERQGRLTMPSVADWETFPFEGDLVVRRLEPPAQEPSRDGEDPRECRACTAPDEDFLWTDDEWRLGALHRPSGLPVVVMLYPRAHHDLGDLPDELAAGLGRLTVRIERAIRTAGDIERVHVGRWGDGSAHLHVWFFGRPTGLNQLRGSFAAIWDDILPPVPEAEWRADLAVVARHLAAGGGVAHV